ncbi:MAG: glycosyltransferase family 2 protein [Desulfobacter sp.]|nr:glycosyltransferase family 2 protein [Desulfobacter sp.]WDP85521.1 MAG: glycosyltransferase family 2 protein [Desulfobacter sp.]
MKVSVILTTYNRPDALKKVLDGLLFQTCLPHEIMVADDGSGPETRSMLALFLENTDVKINHIWQSDKGFRAARIRNKAIAASTGDYLLLLDGDCIPEKHFIQDHMALAEPGFFFQGKRVLVNERQAVTFDHMDTLSFFRLARSAFLGGISNAHHIVRIPIFPSVQMKKLSGVRSCNMGLFREDVIAVNGFNHEFKGWGREDTEFVIRLFRYGVKRRENPFRAICYHLWHNENPRDNLARNDELLEAAAREKGYYCKSGLDSINDSDLGAG